MGCVGSQYTSEGQWGSQVLLYTAHSMSVELGLWHYLLPDGDHKVLA